MKTSLLNYFLVLFICSADQFYAQSPLLQWGKNIGGGSYDTGNDLAVDASGNVYVAGVFGGTAEFDPGPGTYSMTAKGNENIYLCKLDVNGNFVWARQFGGYGMVMSPILTIDASGNPIIAGPFQDTIDVDPGPGISSQVSGGSFDIFVAKINPSGNFLWGGAMGGQYGNFAKGLCTDNAGNIYLAGHSKGVCDVDPGPSSFPISSGMYEDAFVVKLSAQGGFLWAKSFGGSSGDGVLNIFCDATGNLLLSGFYNGPVDFDPGPATYVLGNSAQGHFVSKLDASGNFLWAKVLEGNSLIIDEGTKTDAAGNVYVTGFFYGDIDLDPGPGTFSCSASPGSPACFIYKLNAAGNTVWTRVFQGTQSAYFYDIDVSPIGEVYATGNIAGSMDFDPGPGIATVTAAPGCSFILKLGTNGDFHSVSPIVSTSVSSGEAIVVDAFGSVITVGTFYGNLDCDPGVGNSPLYSSGLCDGFIHKMGQLPTGLNKLNKLESFSVHPNPGKGLFDFTGYENEELSLAIYDVGGRHVKTQLTYDNKIHLEEQDPGLYQVFFLKEGVVLGSARLVNQ